jgi:hypothetical protein
MTKFKHVINEGFFDELLNTKTKFVLTEDEKTEAETKKTKEKADQKSEVVRLEDIKAYIDKYRGKRGRKNRILQIIDDIDTKLSPELRADPIKYAGVHLAQLKTGIEWSTDDIIAVIIGDLELTKKYAKTDVTNIKAKELGQELAHAILDAEKEKADFMKMIYDNMKSGTHKFIHQLPEARFKEVVSDIIGSYKLNKLLLEIFYKSTKEKVFQTQLAKLEKSIIKESEQLTYAYINKFIAELLNTSRLVKHVLKQDEPKGYEVKLKELDKFDKTFQEISGENYMLWPETDTEIRGPEGLQTYFNEVSAYRKEADELIKKYTRREKNQKNYGVVKPIDWDNAKIEKLIKGYIEHNQLNAKKKDALMQGAPHIKTIIDAAEDIIEKNPTLLQYYKARDEKAFYEVLTNIAEKLSKYAPFEIGFSQLRR